MPTISTTKGDVDTKTWFITGASRGFGRFWAEAALSCGDKVAATARKLADVADLTERFGNAVLTLALHVTDAEPVGQLVPQAHLQFGWTLSSISAGYSLVGTVEEASEADVRALFDTTLGCYGSSKLPYLCCENRAAGTLGVSSSVGIVTMPLIGFYCSSKWAVEALHESLAHEVNPFGIKVTLVGPGAYTTKSAKAADVLEPYTDFRKQIMANLVNMP